MQRQPKFVAAALALAMTLGLAAPLGAQPDVGDVAPPLTLKMFDGQKRTLADYRGKVLVINYWATWCGPCKSEMPMMSSFHRRHAAQGLEIVGVVTKDSVPPYQLKKVADLLSYPLASDLKGSYGIVDDGVPSTYIIDRKGRVRVRKAGSFTAAEFSAEILPLLAEPA